MGQVIGLDNIPPIVVASTTSLTLAATNNSFATRIKIGGQQYVLSSGLSLATGTVGFNGMDTGSLASNTLYYVYAVVSSGVVGLVISLSATAPTGFAQYANIGRARTFLASAGLAACSNWSNGMLQSPSSAPVTGNIGLIGVSINSSDTSLNQFRTAEDLTVQGYITITGVSGSPSFALVLPNSFSWVQAKYLSGPGRSQVGMAHRLQAAASAPQIIADYMNLFVNSAVSLTNIYVAYQQGSNSFTPQGSNAFLAGTDSWTFWYTIAIAEWVGLYV